MFLPLFFSWIEKKLRFCKLEVNAINKQFCFSFLNYHLLRFLCTKINLSNIYLLDKVQLYSNSEQRGQDRNLFLDGLIQICIYECIKFGKQPFLEFCNIFWPDT